MTYSWATCLNWDQLICYVPLFVTHRLAIFHVVLIPIRLQSYFVSRWHVTQNMTKWQDDSIIILIPVILLSWMQMILSPDASYDFHPSPSLSYAHLSFLPSHTMHTPGCNIIIQMSHFDIQKGYAEVIKRIRICLTSTSWDCLPKKEHLTT